MKRRWDWRGRAVASKTTTAPIVKFTMLMAPPRGLATHMHSLWSVAIAVNQFHVKFLFQMESVPESESRRFLVSEMLK